MEVNDTSSSDEIFLIDNDAPIMKTAFDILEIITKNKKIIVEGKGEMS